MRRLLLLLAGLVATLVPLVTACGSRSAERWTITDLGTLGGPESNASEINERGQIVGWANTSAKDEKGDPIKHAFLWGGGRMQDLGTLGGPASEANAINERGQIVGWAYTNAKEEDGDPIWHAFLWQSGKMQSLGTLGGPSSEANAINEDGQVIGSADTTKSGWVEDKALGEVRVPLAHAFLWQKGKMVDLGTPRGCRASRLLGINDAGRALGIGDNDPYLPTHSFIWENGRMTDLGTFDPKYTEPGDIRTEASDMNESGQIVGTSDTAHAERAFLWEDGVLTDLGTLAGQDMLWASSWAWLINNSGQIVGFSDTEWDPATDSSERHWFLWEDGKMTDLEAPAVDVFFNAMNDSDQIVGHRWASTTSGSAYRAVVLEDGKLRDLPALGDGEGEAAAISQSGQITGWSKTKSGKTHAVLWTLQP